MTQDFIIADEFCASHHLEISFIHDLKEHGMIETIFVDQALCIHAEELPRLEQIVRLHRDLDINLEGIQVISELLHRIEEMQSEIRRLKKRLNLFEEIQEE
ncbi:MAG TPA: chaperone modulator CbpM [Chitinophagaceae bacterium]|nr:chaperone modulator CbpM [Chitinophagaceae bacterium]